MSLPHVPSFICDSYICSRAVDSWLVQLPTRVVSFKWTKTYKYFQYFRRFSCQTPVFVGNFLGQKKWWWKFPSHVFSSPRAALAQQSLGVFSQTVATEGEVKDRGSTRRTLLHEKIRPLKIDRFFVPWWYRVSPICLGLVSGDYANPEDTCQGLVYFPLKRKRRWIRGGMPSFSRNCCTWKTIFLANCGWVLRVKLMEIKSNLSCFPGRYYQSIFSISSNKFLRITFFGG